MATNRTLLSIIGRLNPAAWDALIPHGPAVAAGFRFGRSLVNVAFVADALGQPVRALAEWGDPATDLDDLGSDAAIAALIAQVVGGGLPVQDDEPKPHWRDDLLAGVALGLASGGATVDRHAFLAETFDAVVGALSDDRGARRAA